MAEKWNKAELGALFPGAIRDALAFVERLNEQRSTAFTALRTTLEVARTVAAAAISNPIEEVLRTLLETIEGFVDGLLDNTTAHAIMIPIQKQYFGLGDPIPPDSVDPVLLVPSFDQLAESGAIPANVLKDITPDTIHFVNTAPTALGGNAGYWRTLVLSTQDPGDLARPDFPETFAVTGVSVIFGAASITDIYRIIALFNRIYQLGLRANLGNNSQPRIDGLRAKIRPMPTEGRIGVQLEWNAVPVLFVKPLFTLDAIVVNEIFVIRSTSPLFRETFRWGTVFSAEPSDSKNDLPSSSTAQVIARLTNDGGISVHVDNDESLEIGTAYYYSLAIRYSINGVAQPMSDFSNTVRVFYNGRPGTSRLSEPPDWFATPSLIQLFPVLETISSLVKQYIASLLPFTQTDNGLINLIDQTIDLIQALLREAETISLQLQELEQLLRLLADANTAGIYTTTFNVSTGGIAAWNAELGLRLSNYTDASRPPFDNAELTAGIVIVAGAPSLSQLAGIRALFDLLFGNKPTNPIDIALRTFNEDNPPQTITFDDTMGSTRTPTVDVAVTPPKPVFDTTMQPATTRDDC